MSKTVVCLAGDGIGPEVMREAIRALEALPLELELEQRPFGGAAMSETGEPLPPATLEACLGADAVLLAAVGLPQYERAAVRPEQGLLALRRALSVFANLRPVRGDGVDVMIVRELSGGLYYGRKGRLTDGMAFDTLEYHPWQVERIARRAFELARGRQRQVTLADKHGVLETSKLWREVVDEVAKAYPDVGLETMLVDNAAMQLVRDAGRFDVLLTENTFGDILSDVAAVATGGVGLAPSASLSEAGPGIFEPIHGSAPDIAGQGVANPAAMLRSAVLMLEHGLGCADQARLLDEVVDETLRSTPTIDLGGSATTSEFGDAVVAALARRGAS
ncbi:MAG: 3-isopropylmalate dehydrogenase [Gaiellales bacterium]|nr:3-isopropylmalate dehydrogenase [Gaiellales bacterium]